MKSLIKAGIIAITFYCIFHTNLVVFYGQLLSPYHYYYDWALASQLDDIPKTNPIYVVEIAGSDKIDTVLRDILRYQPKVIAVGYHASIDSITALAINELATGLPNGGSIVFEKSTSKNPTYTIPSSLTKHSKIKSGFSETCKDSIHFRKATNYLIDKEQKTFSFATQVASMYAQDSLNLELLPEQHYIKYKRTNKNTPWISYEEDIKSNTYTPTLFQGKIVLLTKAEFQCKQFKSPLNTENSEADMSYAVIQANIIEGLIEGGTPKELDANIQYFTGILLLVLNMLLLWIISTALSTEGLYYCALLLIIIELALLFTIGGFIFIDANIIINKMETIAKCVLISYIILPFLSLLKKK